MQELETDFPDLLVVEAFLGDFPYEVGMRNHGELTEEMKHLLRTLAEGKLPEPQRDAVCRDVLQLPEAVEFLAELARVRQEATA